MSKYLNIARKCITDQTVLYDHATVAKMLGLENYGHSYNRIYAAPYGNKLLKSPFRINSDLRFYYSHTIKGYIIPGKEIEFCNAILDHNKMLFDNAKKRQKKGHLQVNIAAKAAFDDVVNSFNSENGTKYFIHNAGYKFYICTPSPCKGRKEGLYLAENKYALYEFSIRKSSITNDVEAIKNNLVNLLSFIDLKTSAPALLNTKFYI